MNKTAKARVAEARAQLWKMSRELFHDEEYANATIDAYRSAVRAEAFEEMRAEAERRFQERADTEPGHAVAYGRLADWAEQQAEKARGR